MTEVPNRKDTIRKLAAIMFTDIAGFTALSAHDEEKAFELIEKQREILKPIVLQYQGKWLKEIGDGLLLSFPGSKLAVNCAIKIQQTLRDIENLNLRIGIHQGDILEKEGDVFGDDVNIASRIEPFAAVGGVAVSDKVNRDISGSPELITKYIGKPKLKGVKQEVKVYCITSHDLPETKLSDVSAKLEKRPISHLKWVIPVLLVIASILYIMFPGIREVPSIGILYMENLGDEEDEFWARGITEDVIIDVASAGLIRVVPMKEILQFVDSKLPLDEIAKKLRVKYLLTSSIHMKEENFDLRTQLIEAKSGKNIYAKKWSEPSSKASTITGTLAQNILKSLGVSTKRDLTKVVTTDPEAYEYYLRGKYKYEKRKNLEDLEIARGFLRRSIKLDPILVKARNLIGGTYIDAGEYDKALKILEESHEIAKKSNNKLGLANTIRNIGLVHEQRGDYDKALGFFEQSLKIACELGDRYGEAGSIGRIGIILQQRGDYDNSLVYFQQALEIALELGDRPGERSALNNIGIVHWRCGEYDDAISSYEQSLEISRELEDQAGEGRTLHNIGAVHQQRGNYDQALTFYGKSLEIARELNLRPGERILLNNIGTIYGSRGDYDKALSYFEQALEITRELGVRAGEGILLNNIGRIYRFRGYYDEALNFYQQSLEITRELGDRSGEGLVLHNIGIVYQDRGDYDVAVTFYEQSLEIASGLGDRQVERGVLDDIGGIYTNRGDYSNALSFYQRSLEMARELGDRAGEGITMHNLGSLYFETKEFDKSVKSFQQAIEIFKMIGAKQYVPVAQAGLALAMVKNDAPQDSFIVYAKEVEKVISDVEEGKIETLWALTQVYEELSSRTARDDLTLKEYRIKHHKFLEIAYNELMGKAQNIKNEKHRKSFLTNVKTNREIVETWEKFKSE